MNENKIGKYLKYAFGEITLVMVGILLAFAVNNWAEVRKEHRAEIKTLQLLKTSLEYDLSVITESYAFDQQAMHSINLLLSHIEKGLPYHDSLATHFGISVGVWSFQINDEPLKDIESISNRVLFQQINNLYKLYKNVTVDRRGRYRDYIQNASINILNTRFDAFWGSNYDKWDKKRLTDIKALAIPNDYEKLKHDQEYLYFLKTLKNYHNWYVDYEFYRIESSMKTLIEDIDKELQVLNKNSSQ